ncbi:hypothetical protein OH76DRAFT_1058569 [Lentinus brumalis]|uniref:Uncharacterized protein n=1 Tax=Lentinus brumalis TaxID=2498619 RepID=A0A371DND0_9APHY|nr:hypothetical protein OH76DRAFT_1058569 [Polyporus brumalis]
MRSVSDIRDMHVNRRECLQRRTVSTCLRGLLPPRWTFAEAPAASCTSTCHGRFLASLRLCVLILTIIIVALWTIP